MYLGGKGAGLTAISGIAYRIKAARTTATTGGGSVITPTPKDPGAQAAKATCSVRLSRIYDTWHRLRLHWWLRLRRGWPWWLGGGKWGLHARL